MTELKWGQFLNKESDLRAILQGETDLPAFHGRKGSPSELLYQAAQTVVFLFRGDYESAQRILADCAGRAAGSQCLKLAADWYEAEMGDPLPIWRNLGVWMTAATRPAGVNPLRRLIRPSVALDRQLARRWAPVLHYYLTTLFSEWSEDIARISARDRQMALRQGVSEAVLAHIDFQLKFAQARQQKSISLILETASEWEDACRRNPLYGSGTEYILEVAVALEYDEQFNEALECLEKGLQQEPDQFDWLLVKARILKRIGQVKACLAICDRLVELAPDDFSGYCLRSNTYFLMGWNERAMADARKACEVAPENPNSFMARAFVLMQLGKYEEALQDFERTLRYDPHRYDALRGQGKCLSMLGHDYEALASFNALRREYPDDPDLYYELADVLFSAGYLDECEKTCRKCLELDPEYVSAIVILGMVALRHNDDDKAHRLLNKAVNMEPDNPFALNELAYLLHLEGDDERALELVDRALEESPEYADALCNKGVIHYFRSEFDLASAIFEQTLKLVPDHVAAWVGKGNTLTQLCEFDDALKCYDKALALDPENADACHGKAILYRMLGLDDEVRKWQERAYMLDNDEED